MCTTANINAHREVPPGRGGLSFSFDPDHATLRGPGPDESVQASTADYEALAGRRRFTLFDVSAISGAAFSPLMGSATMQAYRILFTATDLRLGVWLPHPAVVHAAARELERQDKQGPPRRPVVARGRAAAAGTRCLIRPGGAGTRSPAAGRRGYGRTCSSCAGTAAAPGSSSAGCCTTRCSPPWACCTPRPPGIPATAARGCASPTEATTTTWAWSRPCNERRRWGSRTSWYSTPAVTRRTPGSPSAGPSRWPDPTRQPRS